MINWNNGTPNGNYNIQPSIQNFNQSTGVIRHPDVLSTPTSIHTSHDKSLTPSFHTKISTAIVNRQNCYSDNLLQSNISATKVSNTSQFQLPETHDENERVFSEQLHGNINGSQQVRRGKRFQGAHHFSTYVTGAEMGQWQKSDFVQEKPSTFQMETPR